MMKQLRIFFVIIIPLFLFSCKADPMKDIDSGNWNNERAIVNIVFDYQVGNSTVFRDKSNNGLVSFMFNDITGDRKKVKVKELELSYGAIADIEIGDVLDFDNDTNSASIIVKAQSGEAREWLLTYVPFTDEIIGTWKINTLSVYGGAWPEYGGSRVYADMAERNWNWEQDGTGPIAEYDNTLTFTLEGITESGDTYGKLINDGGVDNTYADFIFIDDPDGARIPLDVNYRYRKIPKGESSWKRNSRQGTITFTPSTGSSVTGKFITAGEETMDDHGNVMTVTDRAFSFDLEPTYIWLDIYKDREQFVENAIKYWVQVSKVN